MRRWSWIWLGLLLSTTPLAAQVGHSPRTSPYRDIRRGHTFTLTGGYVFGNGGNLNIGPQNGSVVGIRYDIRSSRSIGLGLSLGRGNLERFIINPFLPPATRRSGPVNQTLSYIETNLQMNVTGGKSWNRIAPYLAFNGGLLVGQDTPADTSGYDFGNKLYFAPGLGVRLFVGQRLHLRVEGRAAFWKLNFPVAFLGTPENPAVVLESGRTEWVTTPWLQFGLGYSLSH